MVKYDTVLIRYGELSTKGKNRKDFIRRLDRNIRYMLRDFKDLQYKRTYDRIYISGGKVGCQILLAPDDFIKTAWKAQYADLTREHE